MKRIIKAFIHLSLFAAVLLISGCQIAGTGNTEEANIEALEGVFAKTHLAEVESDTVQSKAAVPYFGGTGYDGIADGTIAIPTTSAQTVSNYPEYGQTSVYTIAAVSGHANVYKVTVTTTYSTWSVRETETEVYYIHDVDTDSCYDTTDTVLAANLSTVDTRYRETMQTAFRSSFGGGDSIRYEVIADDSNHGLSPGLAALDSGSMNYDSALAAMATSPATDASATWSSKVTYTESQVGTSSVVSALLGFSSSDTYVTTGTRYYTEVSDNSLSGYQQSNTTLWLEETRATDGSLVSVSITREKYYINTSTGARSTKTVKTKTTLYDDKGNKSMQLDKSGGGLSSLSYL